MALPQRQQHGVAATSAPQDPAILQMLHKMVRPSVDFIGEQVTQRGSVISHQQVEGDARGRMRLDFRDPPQLEGDVMLIGPKQFRNYHKRTNTLDIALWPTSRTNHEQRIMGMLRNNRLVAARMGQETVAGRPADIVEVGPPAGQQGFAFKFWIDSETGVKLKQEVTGPRGNLVYRTYFTRITIGPAANVSPKDFEPAFLQTAKPNPLFPPGAQEFNSMAAARAQLPFTPMEPSDLPSGFHLMHAWVFPVHNNRGNHAAVLMRYSDGLAYFNLYERLTHPNPHNHRTQRVGQRSVQRWRFPVSNGDELEVVYIGLLTPEQIQRIHDSLR